MSGRPPVPTRTDTRLPYTTLFRSEVALLYPGGWYGARPDKVVKAAEAQGGRRGLEGRVRGDEDPAGTSEGDQEQDWPDGRGGCCCDLSSREIGRAHV